MDPTPKHSHGAYRKVILLYAVGMIICKSHGSQQLGLPLRGMLGTKCTCITSVHDAHMGNEAAREACWLQAAPPVTPDRTASRADRQARRLGITSQPDTAAEPGRSPGQPSGPYAAACIEAVDRAMASRSGLTITGNAGEAASKGAAGGKGHKAAVGSASGGSKSSFSFGAALGVKKKPAAAPAAASAALAAAAPAAGGGRGANLPARPAADASEPLRHSTAAAPRGAAPLQQQQAQHSSSSGGGGRDRPGSSGGIGGGPAQAAAPPAFISQLAAEQPPQVDCRTVCCSTFPRRTPIAGTCTACLLHASGKPHHRWVLSTCPMRCFPANSDVVHLHRAGRQATAQQRPRAKAKGAGVPGAADAPGPSLSSA